MKLPITPLSFNCYMRNTRYGRRYITARGKEYKQQLIEALKEYDGECYDCPIELTITFYFNNKRKNDLDNYIKPFLDCIHNIVYTDDRYIYKLVAEKKYNKEPYIEFYSSKLSS